MGFSKRSFGGSQSSPALTELCENATLVRMGGVVSCAQTYIVVKNSKRNDKVGLMLIGFDLSKHL